MLPATDQLEEIPGISPHAAQVIIAYGYDPLPHHSPPACAVWRDEWHARF